MLLAADKIFYVVSVSQQASQTTCVSRRVQWLQIRVDLNLHQSSVDSGDCCWGIFFLVIIIPLLLFRYFLDLRVYVTIYVVELKKQLQIWGNLTEWSYEISCDEYPKLQQEKMSRWIKIKKNCRLISIPPLPATRQPIRPWRPINLNWFDSWWLVRGLSRG